MPVATPRSCVRSPDLGPRSLPEAASASRAQSTRRSFLAATGATIGLAALGCGRTDRPAARRSIVIVGGGLAGLYALDRAVAAGWEATLLEARGRLGGRILTVREPFSAGLTAEAGAERIPHGHRRLQALVQRLGLTTMPPAIPGDPIPVELGRERHSWNVEEPLPVGLAAGLSTAELAAAPLHVHIALATAAAGAAAGDSRSGREWLLERGLTPAGQRLVDAFCAQPWDQMSATDFQASCAREQDALEFSVIVGGLDALTQRLAAPHLGRVRLETPVRRIRLGESETTLDLLSGEVLRADRVILAVSLEALRRFEFDGQVPPMVRNRLDALVPGYELKTHFEVDVAELAARAHHGYALKDSYPRVLWPGATVSASGTRILNAMAVRDEVPEISRAVAEGEGGLRRLMSRRSPEWSSAVRRAAGVDFAADPYIGNTFAFVPAGRRLEAQPIRERGLILAGSDISSWSGWLEGALASAEEALAEALA